MLIVRSPLRISLAGGGTDLPEYYRQFGGAVINTAIDRYVYVFLKTNAYDGLDFASSDFQSFFRHWGDLPLTWTGEFDMPKMIFNHFGVLRGVRLFIASEIPPGTGLGSSSSLAVGLIKALSIACNRQMNPRDLAELASHIEIEAMSAPIGKQDQYAAALGGLNLIEFSHQKTVISPLGIDRETSFHLQRCLLLFYTGQSRSANGILQEQRRASRETCNPTLDALHRVKAMVPEVKRCLEAGDIKQFGHLLHENWTAKKDFAPGITNAAIDDHYQCALQAGAYGGKITGAGGGGFLLICCDESARIKVTEALEARGLVRVGFHFDEIGAHALLNCGLLLTSHHRWREPESLFVSVP